MTAAGSIPQVVNQRCRSANRKVGPGKTQQPSMHIQIQLPKSQGGDCGTAQSSPFKSRRPKSTPSELWASPLAATTQTNPSARARNCRHSVTGDPNAEAHLRKVDPVLAAIIDQVGPCEAT